MSFQQLNLQKDALHSLYQIPPATINTNSSSEDGPSQSQPPSSSDIRPPTIQVIPPDEIDENDDDTQARTNTDCGESWTSLSEIDSQYSRATTSNGSLHRFGASSFELSMVTDSDNDSDSDDNGKDDSSTADLTRCNVNPNQNLGTHGFDSLACKIVTRSGMGSSDDGTSLRFFSEDDAVSGSEGKKFIKNLNNNESSKRCNANPNQNLGTHGFDSLAPGVTRSGMGSSDDGSSLRFLGEDDAGSRSEDKNSRRQRWMTLTKNLNSNESSKLPTTRPPPIIGFASTPRGILTNNHGFNTHHQQHHSIATRIIGGVQMISPREDAGSEIPTVSPTSESSTLMLIEERFRESQEEVAAAREEFDKLTQNCRKLKASHEIQLWEMKEELEAKAKQAKEELDEVAQEYQNFQASHEIQVLKLKEEYQSENKQTKEKHASVISDYETRLKNAQQDQEIIESSHKSLVQELKEQHQAQVNQTREQHASAISDHEIRLKSAQQDQEKAKAKLQDALEKLRMVQDEHAKLIKDKNNLQKELKATQKKVRFAEEQNSILEFQVGDYKTKWEASIQESRSFESKLAKSQSNLDAARTQVKETKESCDQVVASITNELVEERSLRLQLVEKEQELQTELLRKSEQNETLKEEQSVLENTVRSLKTEQKDLLQELETTTFRKHNVEENLSRANNQCHELTLELAECRASIHRLEAEHEQDQKFLRELLEAQLEELKESMLLSEAREQDKDEELAKHQAQLSKLQVTAEELQKQIQQHLQEEERLTLELELAESLTLDQTQKEEFESKLQELQASIQKLQKQDQVQKELLSQQTVEISKLQKDSQAEQSRLLSMLDQEQQQSQATENQLRSELEDSRNKACAQKESSDSELEAFQKSIDALVAKDDQELESLRRSIEELSTKDQHNQTLLSEYEAKEALLKAVSESARLQAEQKFEEEQQRSTTTQIKLESELEQARSRAKDLQIEKNALEETLVSLQQEQSHLNQEICQANNRWRAAEENASRLTEEKRLLKADLQASKYSILRLESERSRASTEYKAALQAKQAELVQQKAIVSSSQEQEQVLQQELEESRTHQQALQDEKTKLETQLYTADTARQELVTAHESSVRDLQAKIRNLLLENETIEKDSSEYKTAKLELEAQLKRLGESYKAVQQSQAETKQELDKKSKEYQEFTKSSMVECEALEEERMDLLYKVEFLRSKELGFEEKIRTLVAELDTANAELLQKEKNLGEMEYLLAVERQTICELEDENEEHQRTKTSMIAHHTQSLLESKEKTLAAQETIRMLELECTDLKAEISINEAEKEMIDGRLQSVKNALTQLQRAHHQSEENLAELVFVQNETKITSENEIAELKNRQKSLEKELESSNLIRTELEATLEDTVNSLAECKCSLAEKERECLALGTKLVQMQSSLSDLEQEKALLVEKNVAASNEKESIIALHAKSIQDHVESAESLKEELQVAQNDVIESRKENGELQKRAEYLTANESVLKERCSDAIDQLDAMTHRLEGVNDEKSLLQSIFQDQCRAMESLLAEKERIRTLLEQVESDNNELRSKNDSARSSVEAFDLERNQLQSKYEAAKSSLESSKAIIDELQSNYEAAKSSIESSNSKNDELQSKYALTQASIESFKAKNDELQTKFETSQASIATSNTAMRRLETERNELDAEVSSARKKEDSLTKNLRLMKEQNASLQNSREALIQEHKIVLGSLESANTKMSLENNELVSEIRSLKEQKVEMLQQCDAAKRDCENLIVKLTEERDHAQLEVKRLEGEREMLQKRIDSIEIAKAKSENTAESKINELKEFNVQLVSERDILQKRIETVECNKSESEEASKSRISELIEGNDRLSAKQDVLQKQVAKLQNENDSYFENLKEAKETIVDLQKENIATKNEKNSLIASLEDAKGVISSLESKADSAEKKSVIARGIISTLQQEANEANEKNSRLIENLKDELRGAKATIDSLKAEADDAKEQFKISKNVISTLRTEADVAKKENIRAASKIMTDLEEAKETIADLKAGTSNDEVLIESLRNDLQESKETISALKTERDVVSKENESLLTNLSKELEEANAKVCSLKSEVNIAKEEQESRTENLRKLLSETQRKVDSLESEAKVSQVEKGCLIANIMNAKGTIATMETEACKTLKENTFAMNKLNMDLKEAKIAILALETEIEASKTGNQSLSANLEEARRTIDSLQLDVDGAAKENSLLAKNLESVMTNSKETISALRKELDEFLAKNCGNVSAMNELRDEVASTKDQMRGIEADRSHLRDQIKSARMQCTKLEEESKNYNVLCTKGKEMIRSLQLDLSKEQGKCESFRNDNLVLSKEKVELESRLRTVEDILAKDLERKFEAETEILYRQLEEANSKSSHLREVVIRLESEVKEKSVYESKQEYLRSLDIEKIAKLEDELQKAVKDKEKEHKTARKLAKLVKRTMSTVTRVSRMKINIDMSYFDTKTNKNRKLPAKAEYSGPVVGSKPHGAGMMTFPSGDMYVGTFENGELSGEGSYIAASYIKSMAEGKGTLKFKGLYDFNEFQRLQI